MMDVRVKKAVSWAVYGVMTTAALVMAAALVWRGLFALPCRLETDCRGRGIEAKSLRRWEETGEGISMGVTALAGWRVEEQEIVTSVSTGRRQISRVIAVYGPMNLVLPGEVLDGKCGVDADRESCVVSEALALHLFGSREASGECIKNGSRYLIIAGVVEADEDLLLIPTEEGAVEYLAVRFDASVEAQEKMRKIMEALDF